MTDFASALLVATLIRELQKNYPELLPADTHAPDEYSDALVSVQQKTSVLNYAYHRGGAIPLIQVGRAIVRLQGTAIISSLLASSTAHVFAQKWMRLEEYYHANHRTRFRFNEPTAWSLHRFSEGERAPTDPENILIFGVLFYGLKAIGCGDLIGSIGGLVYQDSDDPQERRFPPYTTTLGSFNWTQQRSAALHCHDANDNINAQVSHVLNTDIGRVWDLPEIAKALGKSTRSVQREIKKTGHTLSSLVRHTRTSTAGQLLRDTSLSLSEIGFCCGYADQAHFQRDFKRALNMTPRAYRLCLQEKNGVFDA